MSLKCANIITDISNNYDVVNKFTGLLSDNDFTEMVAFKPLKLEDIINERSMIELLQ